MADSPQPPPFGDHQDADRLKALFADRGLDAEPFLGEDAGEMPRYRLERLLGQGGMGAVFAATDPLLRRRLALKVLPDPGKFDSELIPRFVREAQLTGSLEHPNIIPIHELGVDADGQVYYSMKEVKGRSLQDILESLQRRDRQTLQAFPLRRLLRIFLSVCDALAYAHDHGIIHRDLKPANIMVGDFGEVLVLDWGLAKRLAEKGDDAAGQVGIAELTVSGTVMGSPHYMSPEQARSQLRSVNQLSDVYALGGILHAILTLQPPIEGDSVQEVVVNLLNGNVASAAAPRDLPHLPGGAVPAPLWEICLQALAAEQGKRPQSVLELQDRILSVASDNGGDAEQPGGFWQALRRLVRSYRRPAGFLALGVCLVLLAWLVLVVMLQQQKSAAREQLEHRQAAYEELQGLGRTAAGPLAKAARQQIQTGDWQAAAEAATLAVQLDPNHQEAWYLRGIVVLAEGDLPAAHRFLTRAGRGADQGLAGTAQQLAEAIRQVSQPDDPSPRALRDLAEQADQAGEPDLAATLRAAAGTP